MDLKTDSSITLYHVLDMDKKTLNNNDNFK